MQWVLVSWQTIQARTGKSLGLASPESVQCFTGLYRHVAKAAMTMIREPPNTVSYYNVDQLNLLFKQISSSQPTLTLQVRFHYKAILLFLSIEIVLGSKLLHRQ